MTALLPEIHQTQYLTEVPSSIYSNIAPSILNLDHEVKPIDNNSLKSDVQQKEINIGENGSNLSECVSSDSISSLSSCQKPDSSDCSSTYLTETNSILDKPHSPGSTENNSFNDSKSHSTSPKQSHLEQMSKPDSPPSDYNNNKVRQASGFNNEGISTQLQYKPQLGQTIPQIVPVGHTLPYNQYQTGPPVSNKITDASIKDSSSNESMYYGTATHGQYYNTQSSIIAQNAYPVVYRSVVPVNLSPSFPSSTTDGIYMSDSSVAAANAAGKKPKKSLFPPPTRENLAKYREEAYTTNDPHLQLEYAKFLLEATTTAFSRTQDPTRVKKARQHMIMEAQKIVKKLASNSGMRKQGYPDAQFILANCYGKGSLGLQKDTEKAFALYIQGSKQNHPGCTYRAAVCYEVGAGTKRDKNHAMQFYRKAANLGEPTAMYKLSMTLLKGFLGQPKNPREGISWLKRASQLADEDHPHALHELAMSYEKEGIPSVIPDLNYSRELYSQAARYGYAPSQFKLGLAYENGFLNCPIDPRRSIAWYSKAAEQGDLESQFALSGWYLTGAEGILQQNDLEAYLWARKAADRGYAKAQYAVGYYTETGTGNRQNIEEAKRWYRLAATQNYRRAKQRLAELKYANASPQQRRRHTREGNKKDAECTIM